MYQAVFRRYELKYLLTAKQAERMTAAIAPYMKADAYGKTTIRNLYFDTDTYLLIRRSIEKPLFKEKLRLRSYARADENDTVFAELKRKCEGIVYKRRQALCVSDAMDWLCGGTSHTDTQISREIDYFLSFYKNLHPTVFLSYDRTAYYSKNDDGFRVTFDTNILARRDDLSLGADVYGTQLLSDGTVLMEIKCYGSIPMWMVKILSAERIYKTPFSKYGEAYKKLIFPSIHDKETKKTEDNCFAI